MIALLPWCGRVKQPELWDWDPFPSFLNLLQDCSLETVPHPMSFYLTSVRVANEVHIIHETLQKLKTWKHMLELKIFTYILLLPQLFPYKILGLKLLGQSTCIFKAF